MAQLPPHQRSLKDLAEDARAAVLGKAQALVDAAEHDDVYGFIDREAELDDLVEAWCGALDEIERAAGWPNLPPDVRAKVLAAEEVL